MKNFVGMTLIAVACFSCSQLDDQQVDELNLSGSLSDDNSGLIANDEAADKATAILAGTVREVESDYEEGVLTWKVDVITDEGAEVEFYFRQDDLSLVRIDGESGPFNYALDPGNGMISFESVLNNLSAEYSGSLEEWRLRTRDHYQNSWIYTLKFKDPDAEIDIDAVSGATLEVKN